MSDETGDRITVKSHPRAAVSIARTRSRVAAACFALAFVASQTNGAGVTAALGRALGAGVVGWYVGWAAAVTVWRHLVVAEARAAVVRARGAGDTRKATS